MPRGDRSTATRETLLRAAARVFVARGPYGATVREIAEDAGVTVPAIYYHFDGTAQLYETLVREGRSRFRALVAAALAEGGDARARLRQVARAYVRFAREDPTRLRLLCMELFGPRSADGDRDAATIHTWVRAEIDRLVAAALGGPRASTRLAARFFVAIMNGLLVEQARDPGVLVLDDALADRAVHAFLHGTDGRAS